MPNCFTLTKKGETSPSPFNQIDDEMCKALGVDPDPVKYYRGWYDNIGLGLAVGLSWEKMREISVNDPETLKIIDWLEENYVANAWYQRGW